MFAMASYVIFRQPVKGGHANEKATFRFRIVERVHTLVLVNIIIGTGYTNVLVDIRHDSLYLKYGECLKQYT